MGAEVGRFFFTAGGGHWKAALGRSKIWMVRFFVRRANLYPVGPSQAISTIVEGLKRSYRAICRTRTLSVEVVIGKLFVYFICIRSQMYCTSPFRFAVKRPSPVGMNDKKLQPPGG